MCWSRAADFLWERALRAIPLNFRGIFSLLPFVKVSPESIRPADHATCEGILSVEDNRAR